MKALILFVFLLTTITSIAQDLDSIKQTKIGIYQSYKEFQAGKPSVTKPFEIERKYYILNIDTVITGYVYHFIDSTPIIKNAFGLYDGSHFYLSNKKGELEKMDYSGKFVFKFYSSVNSNKVKAGDVVSGVIDVLDGTTSMSTTGSVVGWIDGVLFPQDVVIYLNKKGKLLEATPQSIGVLLRGDKDLLKEYEKEKKYNNNVYIKYLQKMNERYPL